MKQRNSFVSNSSSTSYIIAFKCNEKCKCCGRSDPDFSDLIDRVQRYDYSEDTHIHAKGKNEVIDFVKGEWGDWSLISKDEIIQKIEAFLKDKTVWTVIACQISYHDEIINKTFNEKEANKTLIKIWSDHD